MKYFSSQYFDYKIGIAGALVMGISVFCINYFSTHLMTLSVIAAVKQCVYTFIFGGFLMRGCEYIATQFKSDLVAILLAIVIPSLITLLLTYSLHVMKGTPKPLASVIPTLAIIPVTGVWAIKKRMTLKTTRAKTT